MKSLKMSIFLGVRYTLNTTFIELQQDSHWENYEKNLAVR